VGGEHLQGISKASAICQDISTCKSAYSLSNRTDYVGAILNIYIWAREQWRMFATIPLFPLMDEINLKICKYGFSFEINLVLCPKLIGTWLVAYCTKYRIYLVLFSCLYSLFLRGLVLPGFHGPVLTILYTLRVFFYISLFCFLLRAWDSLSPLSTSIHCL
jgi:hypothetical protein